MCLAEMLTNTPLVYHFPLLFLQMVPGKLLLTYLGPLHEEQRPSTTSRHLTRSWAAFITPFQQVSCCAISVSVLRLQLLRGRPLFLFPCGFHLRAWRVVLFGGFLKVWSIQDHFLLRICLETGSCPVLSHSTSFLWGSYITVYIHSKLLLSKSERCII